MYKVSIDNKHRYVRLKNGFVPDSRDGGGDRDTGGARRQALLLAGQAAAGRARRRRAARAHLRRRHAGRRHARLPAQRRAGRRVDID